VWNFGNGSTSTDANPVHTYATAGFYTVTLTVANPCGTNTFSQLVGVVACNEKVTDGGFENGPGSGAWTEASTNFSTPLCDLAGCGNGGGTGPRTGNYWSWFGGIATFEESSVEQSIGPVPANNDLTLYFWLEQIDCDGPDDFLKVVVDNDTLYTTTGASNLCGVLGYTLQSVNLNAYADGLAHTLKFISRVYGTNGGITNFFVDDISVLACVGSGLGESGFGNDISIYPTPASDIIYIDFGKSPKQDVKIEIMDMLGKNRIMENQGNTSSDQKTAIDISKLSKGVYTISISSGKNVTYRKIVVQ
jgi:PKD repeat protein